MATRRKHESSVRRSPLTGLIPSRSANRYHLLLSLFLSLNLFAFGSSTLYPTGTIRTNLSFPESAVNDVNTIYIPFTLVGQLIMVTATVDTTTGLFMLDTGSERLVLNQHHFPQIQNGRSITSVGNTGLVGQATAAEVDSFRIEGLALYDLEAHLVDLSHIEFKKNVRMVGILGYDVFRDFELFIDFQNKVLMLMRLHPSGQRIDMGAPWEFPYDSMSFELKKHLIMVNTTIHDVKLKMILDSGAELNLIDRKVNRRVLDQFTIIKRVNLIGVGKREVEVLAGVMADVYCGRQHTPKMNTLLTSLDEINDAFGVDADGVLGYEFLKRRRVLINYHKQMLYFFEFGRS